MMLHRGFTRPRILLVDDDLPQLELRALVFEKNGYRVSTATNAVKALEVFRGERISLVIADHLLGGDSGIALAADMKGLKPSVPIALLSGHNPEHLKNIDCFISKTEQPEMILQIVRELIDRSGF